MPLNRLRLALFALFLSALSIQLGAIISVGHKMWPEELEGVVMNLLAIYSVHLTVMIGAMFAAPKRRATRLASSLGWTAVALTVVWNCLLMWRTVAFVFAERDSVSDLTRYFDRVAAASSFLVTGFLAFLFTRAANEGAKE